LCRYGEERDGPGAGTRAAGEGVDTTGGGVDTPAVERIRASVLVAADGVRSAVQRLRLPNKTLNYLGVILVTGGDPRTS
jgi:2-polyprenyl-6-methoxyphenol hydroxylase-like FAD-dependent oxidoreductase